MGNHFWATFKDIGRFLLVTLGGRDVCFGKWPRDEKNTSVVERKLEGGGDHFRHTTK